MPVPSIRFLLIVVVLIAFTHLLPAQKQSAREWRRHKARVLESARKGTIVLSLDTIFNKGIPYAILTRQKRLPHYDYTLFSLQREELASIRAEVSINRDQTPYYAFRFLESEKVAEPERYFGFKLEKKIVEFDLVSNGAINPFGEAAFLKKYPPRYSDTSYVVYIDDGPINTRDIYQPVQRNHSKEIYFNQGMILQDLKIIGKYKLDENIIRFYLPSGIMVAEAIEKKQQEETFWEINLLKDKIVRKLHPPADQALPEITQLLVENNYL